MDIIDAFDLIFPLSAKAKEEISVEIENHHVKKGQILLNFGEIDRYVHFVKEGSGRVYYLRDGLDVTDYIAIDGQFLGGVISVFTRQPSHKAIEILENSIIQSIRYSRFEDLCANNPEINTLGRKMAIFAFLECQKRMEDMRFVPASDRYFEMERKYPGISNRIPLRHIASYLGTTQVSLSRIRAGKQ